jgi:hypothetical protein
MVPMNSLGDILDQLIINLQVQLFKASDILAHGFEAMLYQVDQVVVLIVAQVLKNFLNYFQAQNIAI